MTQRKWGLAVLGVMAKLSLLFLLSSVFSTPGPVSFSTAMKPQRPRSPAAKVDDPSLLSYGDSYDDFASVAVSWGRKASMPCTLRTLTASTRYACTASFPDGNWSGRIQVPLVRARADIWMPQLAVDAENRVWVIWCEQTGQTEQESGTARGCDTASLGPPGAAAAANPNQM